MLKRCYTLEQKPLTETDMMQVEGSRWMEF